jgi:hypothetical protein
VPDHRAAILARFAAQLPDLGARTLDDDVPAFTDRAVIDVDAQSPAPLTPDALGAWADAHDLTLVAVAPWALALAHPNDNRHLARTHARACEMDNVRSWIPDSAALGDAIRLVEERIAPALPLGAARRALVILERGGDRERTARIVAELNARAAAFRGRVSSDVIERTVPDARALADALVATSLDFRAFAYLAKLVDAAAKNGAFPLVRALASESAPAERLAAFFDDIERDRALMRFAYAWAADESVAPLIAYRGVRLDDFAVRLLLRRHGHPSYQHE